MVTGTRAEAGLLRPVVAALRETVRTSVVATGMHLEEEAGSTVEGLEDMGMPVAARVPMHAPDDTLAGHARSVGQGIVALTDALEALDPDIVVVLGDRHEVLAAAVATVYSGRVLAHIHGGDVSGGLDDVTRHTVTKLAHLHFPATAASAERILALGEEPWRVHVVGAPGLDTALHARLPPTSEVLHGLGMAEGPFILFLMHPDTSAPERAADEVRRALEATLAAGLPVVAVASNLDPGGRAVHAVLRRHQDRLVLRPSLPHKEYLALLRGCQALVGNSSSGLIEAPSFGVPVVNVGDRQRGRERAANVIDAAPEEVAAALDRALYDAAFRSRCRDVENPFGDGRAGPRIAGVVATAAIDRRLLAKRLEVPRTE